MKKYRVSRYPDSIIMCKAEFGPDISTGSSVSYRSVYV